MQATLAKLESFQAEPALRDIVQEGRIEVLQSAQAHAQALPLLRARLVQRATEPTLGGIYKRLALSYGALGQRTEQLRAQAESLALDGAWPAAVQMLKEARAVPGNDFATSSQIDSRLREFSEQAKLDREERKKRGEPVPAALTVTVTPQ
jgi:predicted Zn-dependent protease